jgi:hypothetical protein
MHTSGPREYRAGPSQPIRRFPVLAGGGVGGAGQDGKTYVLPRRGQIEQDNQVTIYLLGRVCRPVLKHAQLFRPYRCDEAKRQHEASAQQSSQGSETFDLSCQSATVSQA